MMNSVTRQTAWLRLARVRKLRFSAKSNRSTSGWNGTGTGTVTVDMLNDSILIFSESGQWRSEAGKTFDFSNGYRWELVATADLIRLSHLHQGIKQPVHLFDLEPFDSTTFQTLLPHHCGADTYNAIMHFTDKEIHLRWQIKGPLKNEELLYAYS